MKYKLPIVIVAAASLLAVFTSDRLGPRVTSFARLPDASAESGSAAGQGVVNKDADGQQLVQQATAQLVKEEVLQANIQQQVSLYGQQLLGTGQYRHFGVGANKRLRLELKLQAAGELTSLTQVSDGRHLWTREDFPSGTTLSRIDLRRVRQATEQRQPDADAAQSGSWMVLGGLPRLLASLEAQFQFASVSESSLGNTPVWVIVGTWKPQQLAELQTRFKRPAGVLPEHLPDAVRLVLGRDKVFPLFPYEIQYLKRSGTDRKGRELIPMVTIQLRKVTRRVQMEASQFEYQRGDQVVIDRTDKFLSQVGLGQDR